MNLTFIVAQADNRAIGKDNNLLWHLGGDMRRFKELTMGHPVVMGRRTWESLPKRPLPGRRNIVLTRNVDYQAIGAEVVHSVEELRSLFEGSEEEVMVMGGAAIYRQLLPWASRLLVTWVHREYEADVYFPEIKAEDFAIVDESPRLADEKSGLEYTYIEYKRVGNSDILI